LKANHNCAFCEVEIAKRSVFDVFSHDIKINIIFIKYYFVDDIKIHTFVLSKQTDLFNY